MWGRRVHYVVPWVESSKLRRWLCGTVGSVLIVAWVVMWGHVLGYVVPRGHIMGSAGLVIRYYVVGYVGEGGQISGESG